MCLPCSFTYHNREDSEHTIRLLRVVMVCWAESSVVGLAVMISY